MMIRVKGEDLPDLVQLGVVVPAPAFKQVPQAGLQGAEQVDAPGQVMGAEESADKWVEVPFAAGNIGKKAGTELAVVFV